MNRTLTRRRFVAGAAGMAATVALPRTAAAAKRRKKRTADVCVVGAGLAGLTAARNLARAGRDVIVLEARNRVGGRTRNAQVAPSVVTELGAEFVGPTQDRILALARAVGVDTFPTYNVGSNVLIVDGQRTLYPAATGFSDQPAFVDAVSAIPKLDAMASEVGVAAPWKAPRAAEWDAMTLGEFRDANVASAGGRALFDVSVRGIWGAEATELSLLFALFYVAAAGNPRTPGSFVRLFSTPNAAQESRFVGGSQQVSIEVAKRLGPRVVLRSPVRRIETGRDSVTVVADRDEVRARRVIVAAPPALAGRIEFSPALPRAKARLLRAIVPGNLLKWEAVYDRPFWRDAGLSGQGASDTGPAQVPFDNSPPAGAPGILFSFVGGDFASSAQRQSTAEHQAAFADNMAAFFGEEARTMSGWFEGNWTTDPWTRGCPVGHTGRNVLATLGPQLRKPVGAIHFAGTETADYWFGYMDGAVRSGERAAREVLRSL